MSRNLFGDGHPKYLDSRAQFSECEKYRYTLWRVWDETLPPCAFVGLNPSTADAMKDDPTIRRCIDFARKAGYGGLTMLNLWAWRATDPRDLPAVETDEERMNLETIARIAGMVPRMIAAWGSHPKAERRARVVMPLVAEWWCLGKTKDYQPRHPLYVKGTQPLVRYEP